MTPRPVLVVLLATLPYSAFAQAKKAQPDLPKQQIDQSKADTDLKRAQTKLAIVETDKTHAEIPKINSEAKSAAVQANIDVNMTQKMVDSIGAPAIEGLTSSTDIAASLMELVGTDGATPAEAEPTLKRLGVIIVPEQKYRIAALRTTVRDFLSQWGNVPSSPQKEVAVKRVHSQITLQLKQINTVPGRKAAIGAGQFAQSFTEFLSDGISAAMQREPSLAEQAALPGIQILNSSFNARRWVKNWITSPPDSFRPKTKLGEGRSYMLECAGIRTTAKDYQNDPRAIWFRAGIPNLGPEDRDILVKFCDTLGGLSEEDVVETFKVVNRSIPW
jgi:hypothetical protein